MSPGQEVTVSALYVRDDCNDDGRGPEADPSQDVPVVFVQDGRTTALATADATGDSARVEVTVKIPADAVPGGATLRVGHGEPASVTVTSR
ncbi:MAG TPA: hypothetical protein VFD41_01000 [Actinomycetales bacterium]|nr:hypothetical protein [Actinomycetales bacterium]